MWLGACETLKRVSKIQGRASGYLADALELECFLILQYTHKHMYIIVATIKLSNDPTKGIYRFSTVDDDDRRYPRF